MSDSLDDLLDDVAGRVGAPFAMTAEQTLAYVAMGDRRHGDAPAEVCGMVDPRSERHWCVRPPDHDGNHNRYLEEPASP